MTTVPVPLYRASEIRRLEAHLMEANGVCATVLMKRAGRALLETLLQYWPDTKQITVYCGQGNNAGDGYVLAALATLKGCKVRVIQVGQAECYQGAALEAFQFAQASDVLVEDFETAQAPVQGVVVDALLGIGVVGGLRPAYVKAVTQINQSRLPVLAVDIPTGLHPDTGTVENIAIKATMTLTFIAYKLGLLVADGSEYAGHIELAELVDDSPSRLRSEISPTAYLLELEWCRQVLRPRHRSSHKGDYGHVLVIGGDRGFGGAALIAAEAAARSGSGLVSVATHPDHCAAIVARSPELMACPIDSGQELDPLLETEKVLAIGPGLGQSAWAEQLFRRALKSQWPVVLDADALNLLAEERFLEYTKNARRVLTPHPGEAARLLGVSVATIQADRVQAARQLQERYGGVIVLKGAGTLVCDAHELWLCPDGNPGMASGGMGDLLCGVIAGLLAQGLTPLEAAKLGVSVHAVAADDQALLFGERGLRATDLLSSIRGYLNGR